MAVNFSELVLKPNYDTWSRPVFVLPVASQPGAPQYQARGIFETSDVDVEGADGAIYSDQETILDIREAEFAVLPAQLDRIFIPEDDDAGPELGWFEVVDADTDGGGETTLALRKFGERKPQ